MLSNPLPIQAIMDYLKYAGPIMNNLKPRKSVEITQNCVSENYLFYHFLKQGFLVNISSFFDGSYFRVRYHNYLEGQYWP
jgi:hypothetical protein